ncbi:MAG: hypothetical protein ACP5E3_15780 [Bacteroidales bacterium]
MEEAPLISKDYIPLTVVYDIVKPDIKSGYTYYFKTDSGLTYQVTFGRKKRNYLENIINFSVISDEFEDEYSETNKGEAWRIISTMTEIVRIYHSQHPFSHSYEFSGEFKERGEKQGSSIRTRLFLRTIMRVLDFRFWEVRLEANKVTVVRKTKG